MDLSKSEKEIVRALNKDAEFSNFLKEQLAKQRPFLIHSYKVDTIKNCRNPNMKITSDFIKKDIRIFNDLIESFRELSLIIDSDLNFYLKHYKKSHYCSTIDPTTINLYLDLCSCIMAWSNFILSDVKPIVKIRSNFQGLYDTRAMSEKSADLEQIKTLSALLNNIPFDEIIEISNKYFRNVGQAAEHSGPDTAAPSAEGILEWAGGEQVTLAIVFTDVVGSTKLGNEIGDEAMIKVKKAHFDQGEVLIKQFRGYKIKTIGDSIMAVFKNVPDALDFATELHDHTGDTRVTIRAGIHIGEVEVDVVHNDISGQEVNKADRVIKAIEKAEIWLSDEAKKIIENWRAERHKNFKWIPHNRGMKGFTGMFTLWSMQNVG